MEQIISKCFMKPKQINGSKPVESDKIYFVQKIPLDYLVFVWNPCLNTNSSSNLSKNKKFNLMTQTIEKQIITTISKPLTPQFL